MGKYLNHTWNVAIIFYCMIFGLAFFVTSTLYIVTLDRIEMTSKDNCDDPESWTFAQTTRNLTLPPPCVQLKEWKLFANTGLVYGIVCVFLGIFQLWPICWGLCRDYNSKNSNISQPNPRGKIFKTVATNIVTTHQRLLEKHKKHQETQFWSGCFKFVYRTLTYILMLTLWLTSLIIPIYIAVSLGTTNAFHAFEGQFYSPALALFAICLLSLTFVILSACALICVESDFWNSIEISSSYDSTDKEPEIGDLEVDEGEDEQKEPSKSPTSTSSYV